MSSPPPLNPLPTTTTTTSFLKPRKHSHPSIYQNFHNPQPNSRSHTVSGYPYTVNGPHGFLNLDHLVNPLSAPLQQSLVGGGPTVAANLKVVGQTSVAADNSLRNKNGDDVFVIVRDRKVQVSEGTSLYAQCRSWLKNGFTLEKQSQYPNCVKSLPKPLPASMVEIRKEDDMELEEKTENVNHLSAKELLQQHVKHAKKVRARLRNQRLQRIERYKDRLALLLPAVADQQPKNYLAS